MKNLMIMMVAIMFTIGVTNAQEAAKEAVQNAAADKEQGPVDFTEALGTDLNLSADQKEKVREINHTTWEKYNNIEDRYKTSDEVFQNRVRTLLQERDAQLQEVLTLDQFAIYMKNRAQYQDYESKYYSDDLKMKVEEDGDVKVKTDEGKIKIKEDKIKIKNEETDTKTKIKDDKVKVKGDDGQKMKVKTDEDKVKVKTDEKKVIIEDDEAKVKTDDKKIKIEEND